MKSLAAGGSRRPVRRELGNPFVSLGIDRPGPDRIRRPCHGVMFNTSEISLPIGVSVKRSRSTDNYGKGEPKLKSKCIALISI